MTSCDCRYTKEEIPVIDQNFKKAELILDVYKKFGQIGIWYCDKITNDEEVSEEWAAMIGYTYEELNPSSDAQFIELLHPDDVLVTHSKAEALYKGDTKEFSHEFRLKHKDGHYVWVHSKAQVYTWEGNRPRLVIGTHVNIDHQKKALEKIILQNHAIVSVFSKVVEYKDSYTRTHMDNVAELSTRIGVRLQLEDSKLQNVWISAKLHDLGKLNVPTEILNKPGKLTYEEYEIAKTHSAVGHELLSSLDFGFPLADIVRQHHERLDGSGYPDGLRGDKINYLAQIIAVADIADAMLSDRPYRKKMNKNDVFDIMGQFKGTHYHTEIIDACIEELLNTALYAD